MKKPRKRRHNCKHAGDTFKIGGVTHLHCEHPRYTKEDVDLGKISPWDTLREFWETCSEHELKSK